MGSQLSLIADFIRKRFVMEVSGISTWHECAGSSHQLGGILPVLPGRLSSWKRQRAA